MSDTNLSFIRNLKGVCWGKTLRINLLRSVGAGLVWALFAYGLGAQWRITLAVAALVPAIHLLLGLPIGVAAYALAECGIPLGGLLGLLVAIVMLPGDPLVFLSTRFARWDVPVRGVRLFQVTPVLLLTRTFDPDGGIGSYELSSISGQ
jgi:hypothetical protein